MKSLIHKIFIILAVLPLVFSGCKKDEDDSKKDQVVYDGDSFELTKGYVHDFTSMKVVPTAYEFAIFLASDDVNMPDYDPPIGTGNWVGFWLYSTSDAVVANGPYSFAYPTTLAYTFWGEVMLESSYMMKSMPISDIASGTLTIHVNGDIYEIEFEGTIEGGDEVEIYYKGKLTSI
jgi:hypothetical protein